MKKKSVLFVCLGNICRSPMAETIFNNILHKNMKTADFQVDSAGLLDYHEGDAADHRMRTYAQKRGYNITHCSRPISSDDFDKFDYIIGMDDQNINQLERMANHSKEKLSKIHKMTEYLTLQNKSSIPDPYYGGAEDFENVIDLLEEACEGLYSSISN